MDIPSYTFQFQVCCSKEYRTRIRQKYWYSFSPFPLPALDLFLFFFPPLHTWHTHPPPSTYFFQLCCSSPSSDCFFAAHKWPPGKKSQMNFTAGFGGWLWKIGGVPLEQDYITCEVTVVPECWQLLGKVQCTIKKVNEQLFKEEWELLDSSGVCCGRLTVNLLLND